jgi:hypothetical protein
LINRKTLNNLKNTWGFHAESYKNGFTAVAELARWCDQKSL